MSPGYLHINPISAVAANGKVSITPEAMVQYPEDSPEFAYILSLLGTWDYYLSPQINLNGQVVVTVTTSDDNGSQTGNTQITSGYSAYIYGWPPGSPNYMGCTAFILFNTPTLVVSDTTTSCFVNIVVSGDITFNGTGSVEVYVTQPPLPSPGYSDVTIEIDGQGTTNPQAGHHQNEYHQGSNLTIIVTPAAGYDFDHITRNGQTIMGTTITNLGVTEIIHVYFAQSITPPSYSNVTITIVGQGTTIPEATNYPNVYLEGTDLAIQVAANSGWQYVKMTRNGVDWTGANPGEFLNLAAIENIEVILAPAENGGGDNTALIAGAGVAVAVIAGSIYYYQRRRKRK